MAAAWKELVKGYRVHVDCGVRDIGQLCELATTLQVAGKDPVLCRYHAFGCWKIAEERFSTVASEVRRLEAENALLRVERSIERMQEVVDPVGVAEEKLQEMTRRVVRMRIEAKVAEHELAEHIAQNPEEDQLVPIRERLIHMLDDAEEQTMDLATKVAALDKEVESWKQRAVVAEATLKRQKMVGKAVSKEEVFAVLGDPATWEADKIHLEAQDHRPLAEAMAKLPDAQDVEKEIFEHEQKEQTEQENFKLLANELWQMTWEKEQASLQRNTAQNRADAYEKILDLLVIDEEAWADRLVLINVKNFVKAQNLVIADMRAKADTDFPKEW
jgi:hypothetical protein